MDKIRVCHISTVHSAFDDRIFYKECTTLANHNFDVTLIACNPADEVKNGVRIIGLPVYESRIKRFIFGFFLALTRALKIKAEIYHFHDPELIPLGLILKLCRKKVIYDMHELTSTQIESKEWLSPLFGKMLRSGYLLLEYFGVRLFDAVILVGDGYLSFIEKHYKKWEHKFFRLRNYSILRLIDPVIAAQKSPGLKKQIIYVGGLSRIRGIREIVMAMEFINPEYQLVLLGKFDDPVYQQTCEELQQWSRVSYEGFHPLEYVYGQILNSEVALALLYSNENYMTSLPVKAFEYMALSKPIVMSDFPYWMNVFKGCALFVDPYDPVKIAEAINELINHPQLSRELGITGRQLVEKCYAWESEEPRLIYLYNQIIRNENFTDQ